MDNNDTSVPGSPSGLISLNPESTQEFRVITNNFLPEYGRNNGAIIDIITKSGTNTLHGMRIGSDAVNALGARDFFNTKPDPQDPMVRNDFGYSVGGPIIKDRTFFFFNSEYQRFRTTLTKASIVPTAAFKSGIFTFDGFHVNLADPNSPNNAQHLPLDPTVQKLLTLLARSQRRSRGRCARIYRFPSSSKLQLRLGCFQSWIIAFLKRTICRCVTPTAGPAIPTAAMTISPPGLDQWDSTRRCMRSPRT